ncbi:MAG: hypothetical protein RLZZ387_3207 [Chloroflexota bacterium]|jgi:hypothetical protein
MDITLILALVLFFGMVASWFVLPATTSTGVADLEGEPVGLPSAQKA